MSNSITFPTEWIQWCFVVFLALILILLARMRGLLVLVICVLLVTVEAGGDKKKKNKGKNKNKNKYEDSEEGLDRLKIKKLDPWMDRKCALKNYPIVQAHMSSGSDKGSPCVNGITDRCVLKPDVYFVYMDVIFKSPKNFRHANVTLLWKGTEHYGRQVNDLKNSIRPCLPFPRGPNHGIDMCRIASEVHIPPMMSGNFLFTVLVAPLPQEDEGEILDPEDLPKPITCVNFRMNRPSHY